MCAQSLLRQARQACRHLEVFFLQGLLEQASWSSYAPVCSNIPGLSCLGGSRSFVGCSLPSQRFHLKTSTTWCFPWDRQLDHAAELREVISPYWCLRAGLSIWHFCKRA